MELLIIVPWVLTVGLLLTIIILNNRNNKEDYSEEEYPMPFEDYDSSDALKVAVYEDRAYFVMDNVFYETEITREPDFSTAKEIDTMSLPKKELNKLLTILDELEEYGKETE